MPPSLPLWRVSRRNLSSHPTIYVSSTDLFADPDQGWIRTRKPESPRKVGGVPDPDLYVFGPSVSGSISTRYRTDPDPSITNRFPPRECRALCRCNASARETSTIYVRANDYYLWILIQVGSVFLDPDQKAWIPIKRSVADPGSVCFWASRICIRIH